MRARLIGLLSVALLGCSGGDTCEDACDKMAKCLGYTSEDGTPKEKSDWQSPRSVGKCDAQKKSFARCNLEATCEEIKTQNSQHDEESGSSYLACKAKCASQYFEVDGGEQPEQDGSPSQKDSGIEPDLDPQYWSCHLLTRSYVLSDCSFGWHCPWGDDHVLECRGGGESHSCTCKKGNEGTVEGSFSTSGICDSELPDQEVTDRANMHCGWKIQETVPQEE